MTSSPIYTTFLLFLLVIGNFQYIPSFLIHILYQLTVLLIKLYLNFDFAGAKLIVSQNECNYTESLFLCTKDRCMDFCKDKYEISLSFKKQNKRSPRGKELLNTGNPAPEYGESSSTWGECKNTFSCCCHFLSFECPTDLLPDYMFHDVSPPPSE